MDNMISKTCKCGAEYKKQRPKDINLCTKCRKQYFNDYRARNLDKMRQYAKKGHAVWKSKSPNVVREVVARSARNRRKKLQLGTATLRQVLAAQLCQMRKSRHRRKRQVAVESITVIDLIALWHTQGGKCALSNLPMSLTMNSLLAVSVDRKVSSSNYKLDNIQLVCRWANLGKGSRTDTEMLEIIKLIRDTTAR